jgi:hypothetical protein
LLHANAAPSTNPGSATSYLVGKIGTALWPKSETTPFLAAVLLLSCFILDLLLTLDSQELRFLTRQI